MPDDALSHRGLRAIMRWLMAAFYFAAGLLHLTDPAPFMTIVPAFVPWPREVVLLTGVCEILGSVALMLPIARLRSLAGITLAAYAVCVFPANLTHAFQDIAVPGLPTSWWYHAPRLAFQPVLVWWALFAAGVINWPFAKRRRSDTPIRAAGA
jgi:uncharacterized membrane protein